MNRSCTSRVPATASHWQRFQGRVKHWLWLALALLAPMPALSADLRFAFAPNIGSLSIYAAQEFGFFDQEGVRIQAVECRFGKECLQKLVDGKAELATVADLPLVVAAFSNQSYTILSTLNTNRSDTKVVIRRSAGANSARDLVGKRVGTLLGTTAQYALDSLLWYDGVDPASVNLIDMPLSELQPALLERRIDAVAVFEPWASQISTALGTDAVAFDMRRIYKQTWNLIASPSLTVSRKRELVSVLRALRRANKWIASEPAAAKALLRQRLGISAELVEESWSSLTFALSLKQSLLTTLEIEARWALGLGLVQGKQPNFLDYVDPSHLRVVDKSAVTLAK